MAPPLSQELVGQFVAAFAEEPELKTASCSILVLCVAVNAQRPRIVMFSF